MKFDEEVDVQKSGLEENESSEFEEVREGANRSIPASSSSSSSDNERTEIDNSDNDSGFVGMSHGSLDRLDVLTTDEKEDVDGNCTPEAEANEIYDRESCLRKLANPKSIGRFKKILEIVKTQKDSPHRSGTENNDEGISTHASQGSIVDELREALQAVPDSILHFLTGIDRRGDCGRPADQKPDWLDEDKLRMGQKFAQDYMFPIYYAEMLSLFALFSFEEGLKPLIITKKSSTPYTAFKRYLSTGLRVRNWYTQDPWAEGTAARKDISTVRAMHAAVRRKLEVSTNEEIDIAARIPEAWCPSRQILHKDFSDACEAPAIGQCPYMTGGSSSDRPKGINQWEMACTQWGFVGLIICYPKYFGVHYATDEELEAFCHLWRNIGYQLGIEDEFNFCRGTLDEIRQRSHDFIEVWVKPNLRLITPEWEHMMRCIFSGMEVVLAGNDFETSLLYLSEILDLKMPRLYASLSYKAWIEHNLRKYLLKSAIKFPGITSFLNNLLNRAMDRSANSTAEMLKAIELKLRSHPANGQSDKEEIIR